MAGERTAAFPPLQHALARLTALPTRNIRATVLLCVLAIAGCFAAVGAIQMQRDRLEAAREAAYFETGRAGEIAAVVSASLSRFKQIGEAFAAGTLPAASIAAEPGLRGIAVADGAGQLLSQAGEPIDTASAAELAASGPVVLGTGERTLLAFAEGDRLIAVSFDSAALAPDALLSGAVVTGTRGTALAGRKFRGEAATARVASWPASVAVARDDNGALAAWYGSLPLYLFVILGPALVGAGLAAVFVREFEKRAKASEAVRALRATRPGEAQLLIRLANAERAAAEAQRSKGEFIAHMSHELRTPLNAIIGFSEVIERGFYGPAGHPKYVEYARDIGMAGRGLHDKIGDILEFANLEAGRYPLKLCTFDAAELAGACVGEQAGRAFSRRIALEMSPAAPAPVRADPMAVRRILANLLSNALNFTQEGGHVHVSLREEEGAIAIAVIDNGNGFSANEKNDAGGAFKRFERAGVSTGTGLGLAVAVSLARRMGGAVRLDSTYGEGTLAELRLPKV
jgi:signal transduction histidine kinase